jgi:hypothetical protein
MAASRSGDLPRVDILVAGVGRRRSTFEKVHRLLSRDLDRPLLSHASTAVPRVELPDATMMAV